MAQNNILFQEFFSQVTDGIEVPISSVKPGDILILKVQTAKAKDQATLPSFTM